MENKTNFVEFLSNLVDDKVKSLDYSKYTKNELSAIIEEVKDNKKTALQEVAVPFYEDNYEELNTIINSFKKCPNLKKISLQNIISTNLFKIIQSQKIKTLVYTNISFAYYCKLDHKTVTKIVFINPQNLDGKVVTPNLRKLSIIEADSLRNKDLFNFILKIKALETLTISQTSLEFEDLLAFLEELPTKLKHLQKLYVSKSIIDFSGLTEDSMNRCKDVLTNLFKKLPNLELKLFPKKIFKLDAKIKNMLNNRSQFYTNDNLSHTDAGLSSSVVAGSFAKFYQDLRTSSARFIVKFVDAIKKTNINEVDFRAIYSAANTRLISDNFPENESIKTLGFNKRFFRIFSPESDGCEEAIQIINKCANLQSIAFDDMRSIPPKILSCVFAHKAITKLSLCNIDLEITIKEDTKLKDLSVINSNVKILGSMPNLLTFECTGSNKSLPIIEMAPKLRTLSFSINNVNKVEKCLSDNNLMRIENISVDLSRCLDQRGFDEINFKKLIKQNPAIKEIRIIPKIVDLIESMCNIKKPSTKTKEPKAEQVYSSSFNLNRNN